jgi:hypothetical protein
MSDYVIQDTRNSLGRLAKKKTVRCFYDDVHVTELGIFLPATRGKERGPGRIGGPLTWGYGHVRLTPLRKRRSSPPV